MTMLYKSFLHFSKLQIYMASNPVFHVDYYPESPNHCKFSQ